MDASKITEYFDYEECGAPTIHVVGCGAIGSHVLEQLARMNITNVHIYDFDVVESKNIANQMFLQADIHTSKVDAVEKMMLSINDNMKIVKHPSGLTAPYILSGIVILAVDNIELRKEIVMANQFNPNITFMCDFRMRLIDAQYYAADWKDQKEINNFLSTMQFSQAEGLESTPVSACGVTLSVCYTVKTITCLGIANLVAYLLGNKHKTMAMIDMPTMNLVAY